MVTDKDFVYHFRDHRKLLHISFEQKVNMFVWGFIFGGLFVAVLITIIC